MPPDPPSPERHKTLAFGNITHGTIAIGNVVSGFVAIGNVARGFIAIGNVAIGFIAIGNVSFGVVAIGATNAVGLIAGSFLNVLPGLFSLGGMNVAPVVPFGIVAIGVLAGASFLFPGARVTTPGLPPLASRNRLFGGQIDEGWTELLLESIAGDRIVGFIGGKATLFEAEPEAIAMAETILKSGPPAQDIPVRISLRARHDATGADYRDGTSKRVLVCRAVVAMPPSTVPWANARQLQWYLARGARLAAGIGLIVWILLLILG